MARTEFKCDCGAGVFLAATDNRSYAAYLIPEQDYDALSTIVDDAIEKSGPTPRDKDAACIGWRKFPMPHVWQCPNCGSLYVEARDGQRHRFSPA